MKERKKILHLILFFLGIFLVSCSGNNHSYFGEQRTTPEIKKIESLLHHARSLLTSDDSIKHALDVLNLALDKSYKANYIKGIAKSSGQLGTFHVALSNLSEATGNFHISIKNAELIKDTLLISNSLFGLGLVMYDMNQWQEAISYFTRSNLISRNYDFDLNKQSSVNYLVGLCYHKLGSNRKASNHLAVAKGYALEQNDSMRLKEIRICLNNIELQHRTDPLILQEYDELLQAFQKKNEKVGISYALEGKARYFLKVGMLNEATIAAKQSLEVVKELNIVYPLKAILEVVIQAEYQAGNYKAATEHLMELQTIKDSIQGMNAAAKVILMTADYEFDKKKKKFQSTIAMQSKQRFILVGVALVLFSIVLLVIYLLRNVSKERKRSDKLLLNILPKETANELKLYGKAKAKLHKDVTIVFADIKGFTSLAADLNSNAIVLMLDAYFSAFDDVVRKYGLEKIKTIGDAYMFISGLYLEGKETASFAADASLEIIEIVQKMNIDMKAKYGVFFEFRFGMHTGDVVSGVVGKDKYAFDVWGDSVNLAARMEESSLPGKLNISKTTYLKLKDNYECISRGEILAKNKGKVQMYFVEQKLA